MNLKVFYVSFINLLVALVVNSTNALSNPNNKYLDLAKESYINQNYAEGDFYIARYLGNHMENNGRYTNPYAPHPDNPTAWTAQRHNGCKVASWGGQYVGITNIDSLNSWDYITLCSCFKEPCSNSENRLEEEIKYE